MKYSKDHLIDSLLAVRHGCRSGEVAASGAKATHTTANSIRLSHHTRAGLVSLHELSGAQAEVWLVSNSERERKREREFL